MARTVQRLDEKKQLYIKGKLFQLVHNAELETLNEKDATSVPIETFHSPVMDLFTLPLNPVQNTTIVESTISGQPHFTNKEIRSRQQTSYISPTTSAITPAVSHFTNAKTERPRIAPTTSTVTSGVSHHTNTETVHSSITPTTSTITNEESRITNEEILHSNISLTIPRQVMRPILPTHQITILNDQVLNASYDNDSCEVDEELKKYVVFK
ncbi:unnamed protein product [Parnassius apollo]|uniref:(apollo) hypothetical protein n=1 Tax=Parnassius apollo TaxID=110799 RepID=A0A8S3W8W9_PARAO|nr:unnamed protein product [Parnassius apollo]